jgi:hypothetical protein
MKDCEAFLLVLLHSATCAHIQHWQTKNYSEHKALRKYYEGIIPLTDALAESYMGKHGQVGAFDEEYEFEKNPKKYFKALQEFVGESREHLPDDSELQNLVDAIMDLINTTVYKLENLS